LIPIHPNNVIGNPIPAGNEPQGIAYDLGKWENICNQYRR